MIPKFENSQTYSTPISTWQVADWLRMPSRCLIKCPRENLPHYSPVLRLFVFHVLQVSVNEVEALHVLYRRLCSSVVDEGLINKNEFQLALLGNCGQRNLFVDRVFDLFDLKNNGVIRFEDFVRSLSIFHPSSSETDKIDFAFSFYDVRNTGYIEREELKEMLLALFEELNVTPSDNLVEAILEKTFEEVDLKKDGKIDQEEWREYMARNPFLMKNMTLPCLKELTITFPSFFISSEVYDLDLRAERDNCGSNSSKSSGENRKIKMCHSV